MIQNLTTQAQAAATSSLHGLWWELLTISVSGAFGGFINAIVTLFDAGRTVTPPSREREPVRIVWKGTNGVPLSTYIAGQCAIGVGGAYAATLALFAVVRATLNSSQDPYGNDALYCIGVSLVAGFIGNQLLKIVGKKLVDQLARDKSDEAKEKSEEAIVKASEATEAAGLAVQTATKVEQMSGAYRNMMTDVFVARDIADKIEHLQNKGETITDVLKGRVEVYKKKLEVYSKMLPCDRALHIVLANLYSAEGYHAAAIEVLERFVNCREKEASGVDNDVASAWLNIACEYVSQMQEGTGNEAGNEALRSKAVEALRRTLVIAKESSREDLELQKSQIRTDCDLNPIREDAGFLELSAEFGIEKQSPAEKAKCDALGSGIGAMNQSEAVEVATREGPSGQNGR